MAAGGAAEILCFVFCMFCFVCRTACFEDVRAGMMGCEVQGCEAAGWGHGGVVVAYIGSLVRLLL